MISLPEQLICDESALPLMGRSLAQEALVWARAVHKSVPDVDAEARLASLLKTFSDLSKSINADSSDTLDLLGDDIVGLLQTFGSSNNESIDLVLSRPEGRELTRGVAEGEQPHHWLIAALIYLALWLTRSEESQLQQKSENTYEVACEKMNGHLLFLHWLVLFGKTMDPLSDAGYQKQKRLEGSKKGGQSKNQEISKFIDQILAKARAFSERQAATDIAREIYEYKLTPAEIETARRLFKDPVSTFIRAIREDRKAMRNSK